MEPNILERIVDGRDKPTNLPFTLLKNITENFSEDRVIGHGGFAMVYKGVLPNGSVAVKRIRNGHSIDEKLFYREVDSLLTISHQNIVRFLGFCASTDQIAIKIEESRQHIYAEIRERLICLEYINNGSLQKYITDELRGLEWNTRYQIIRGICEGLHHLHKEKQIYHMDLKPANILLDNHMVPKITDFGLSRLDEKSQTMNEDRLGSLGYCAPEYLRSGIMSYKSDIFSLGIIITQLVRGYEGIPDNNKNNVLRRWRHRWRRSGKETPLVYQQVAKCMEIGLVCQEIDPSKRPFIWDLIHDVREMEGVNGPTNNACEYTFGQISPYSDDDMLEIEPLDLHLPFEQNKQTSNSLQLTNETSSYIAFNIKNMSPLPYCIEPHKGIVPPGSKCNVCITLQPRDKAPRDANEFIVLSTKVNSALTDEDITTSMFNKGTGNVVDEVNLYVTFAPQLQTESGQIHQALGNINEVTPGSSALLDVHPLELHFRFEPNKFIPCSLYLTNNTDEKVAFRLVNKTDERACFLKYLPLFGRVDPGTSYTLVLIMDKHKNLPQKRNVDLILQTSTYYEGITKEELGNTVHKVTLRCVCALQGETILESIPPSIKFISMEDYNAIRCIGNGIYSIDAIQTEPLIIIGHQSGHVLIWNYDTQKSMGSIQIQNEARAFSVKFIARKGWCLVGSNDGFIHVYDYKNEMEKITSFKANGSHVNSVAIHPTQPYVLSAGGKGINLWDCDQGWFGWKHKQTFKEHSGSVWAIAFNPEDYNCFASASHDGTVKVWSLDSPKSKYTLSGHSKAVRSLDFFTRDGQQYLITGSRDKTAKIWDIQKEECVRTLPHTSEVLSALSHPELPLLVTGTHGGDVYFWSSTSFRLERILKIGGRTCVIGFACLNESGRVVVAHKEGLSVIEVPDEEEGQGSSNCNDKNSISATD